MGWSYYHLRHGGCQSTSLSLQWSELQINGSHMTTTLPILDPMLVEKYDHFGPRYTSYPTALEFHEEYDEASFSAALADNPTAPFSLYIHLPFCHRLCYFCGCNKVITRHNHKADEYLEILRKEIEHRAPQFSGRQAVQLHWGGGTPTFLSHRQISQLMEMLRANFHLSQSMESAIEVDPREVEVSLINYLHQEGFNRISIGVQDLDKDVQRAVNREQDQELLTDLLERARILQFSSINLDLIYGLPRQSLQSFDNTIKKIIELAPDRLSLFNYAHLPQRIPAQRRIDPADLPSPKEKLAILQGAIKLLTEAGYCFIGMDHFAMPGDELVAAQRQGSLKRNFQGYTTHGGIDILGIGVSAISTIGNSHAQNRRTLADYTSQVNQSSHAVWRGITLTEDDRIRRDIIQSLMCHFELEFRMLETSYSVQFTEYFAEDLLLLQPLEADGLVAINKRKISVTPSGRLLVRNIALCFDRYARNKARLQCGSRLI